MLFRKISVLAIIMILAVCCMSIAADRILDTTCESVTVAMDKNGNEYVRIIVNETRTMQGNHYTTGVAVMAFGPHVAAARNLKAGDSLKCIVSGREYNGRTSYTVLSFM